MNRARFRLGACLIHDQSEARERGATLACEEVEALDKPVGIGDRSRFWCGDDDGERGGEHEGGDVAADARAGVDDDEVADRFEFGESGDERGAAACVEIGDAG